MTDNKNDLTQGSVLKKLWNFTLPFIGANLIQTLYSMVDLYIVGRAATTADVSAVSVASLLINTFTMLLIGLSVGATVVVGQRFGSGDRSSLSRVASATFSVAAIVGVGLAAVSAALTVPALHWINTPAEAMRGAIAYMLICSIGYIFQSFYNMLAGFLRGIGDSRSPMIFVCISSVLNIIGDIILVWGFGMGAAGAAVATMLAQAFCAIFGILYVKRHDFPFDFKPKSFHLEKPETSELLHIGIPTALQETLVMFSFIILEGIINRFGLSASAGAGIVDKFFLFATIPTNSFYAAISAMTAQNIGAEREDRAKKCMWYGMILSECFAVFFFLLAALIPGKVVGIFTTDTSVIEQGVLYFAGYKYEYILCAMAFCVNGFINGTGHTKLTLVTNVVSTYAVRIPACVLMGVVLGGSLFGIGYMLPIASAIQALVGLIFFFTGKWRAKTVRAV